MTTTADSEGTLGEPREQNDNADLGLILWLEDTVWVRLGLL